MWTRSISKNRNPENVPPLRFLLEVIHAGSDEHVDDFSRVWSHEL